MAPCVISCLKQLSEAAWPDTSSDFLKDVSDAEFLKVMLLAVQDSGYRKAEGMQDGEVGGSGGE